MNDQESGVPASYEQAGSLQEKVIFALALIGEGPAEEVVRRLEELEPDAPNKEVIGLTHRVLSELYGQGLIAGREQKGSIIYKLHQGTGTDGGTVNPGLPAPGLD